jgi:6-phosphogluconolactonase
MGQAGQLRVVESKDELREVALDLLLERAQEALQQRGSFHVAVSGGSTPVALYEALPLRCADFSGWHVWSCDERCVPPDHADSNFRQLREVWLDRATTAPTGVHRMRGEDDPEQAARGYERELRAVLGAEPRLDLALLGVGADGHTASLFPASAALEERSLLVAAVRAPAQPPRRITLTLPALELARELVFLVAGPEKAAAVRGVLAPRDGQPSLPARLAAERNAHTLWIVDRSAAALVPGDD